MSNTAKQRSSELLVKSMGWKLECIKLVATIASSVCAEFILCSVYLPQKSGLGMRSRPHWICFMHIRQPVEFKNCLGCSGVMYYYAGGPIVFWLGSQKLDFHMQINCTITTNYINFPFIIYLFDLNSKVRLTHFQRSVRWTTLQYISSIHSCTLTQNPEK